MITRAWRTPTVLAIVPLPATDDPRRATDRGRELQRRTEVLEGVTAVDVCGLVDDQLQVRLDPARLAAYGLTATDLLAALRANTALPAGRIDATGVATTIRTTGAGLADLEGLPLRDGVRLRDVAVLERAAVASCVGHTPAGPGLIVAIEVRSPATARAVAAALRDGGAEVLPPQTVVGLVALPDADADVDAIAGELLRAGAPPCACAASRPRSRCWSRPASTSARWPRSTGSSRAAASARSAGPGAAWSRSRRCCRPPTSTSR
ncbi:MAG: efflux RND transporter permease subunit [Myxococcales bacterium]|nr:efflux RND transporter permease subunit [Myxococcales bacterium]